MDVVYSKQENECCQSRVMKFINKKDRKGNLESLPFFPLENCQGKVQKMGENMYEVIFWGNFWNMLPLRFKLLVVIIYSKDGFIYIINIFSWTSFMVSSFFLEKLWDALKCTFPQDVENVRHSKRKIFKKYIDLFCA